MRVKSAHFVLLWSGILVAAPAAPPSKLSLTDYLSQVRSKNKGVQALHETSEAANLRKDEAGLLTFPSLYANINLLNDQKETANSDMMGSKTVYKKYELGVAEQFPVGLAAKLSYNVAYTQLTGTNILFVPQPEFFEAYPKLELNLSLWQNLFGRQTRATRSLVESAARATHHADSFKEQMTMAEAEMTYWRLVLSREMASIQKEALDRTKKILEWNSRRAKMELADRADQLQAAAGYKGKELEYQAAIDEYRSAQLAFNSMRAESSDTVTEDLQKLDLKTLLEAKAPERKGNRQDVLAAEQARNVAIANSEIGSEKNKPTLDLMSSMALNGREDDFGPAKEESFTNKHPTLAIGVKFSTPLDFGTLIDNGHAYAKEIQAAELQYQRKLFEQEQTWKDLTAKFSEAKKRLALADELEGAQKAKLEHERNRLKRGRSVTYQVLLFETDYLTSLALRIKIETEILGLLAQMKTFGEAT